MKCNKEEVDLLKTLVCIMCVGSEIGESGGRKEKGEGRGRGKGKGNW